MTEHAEDRAGGPVTEAMLRETHLGIDWSNQEPSGLNSGWIEWVERINAALAASRVTPEPAALREDDLNHILGCLQADLVNAKDSFYRAELQYKRMPYDHDNNDAMERYKRWVIRGEAAITAVRAALAAGKP